MHHVLKWPISQCKMNSEIENLNSGTELQTMFNCIATHCDHTKLIFSCKKHLKNMYIWKKMLQNWPIKILQSWKILRKKTQNRQQKSIWNPSNCTATLELVIFFCIAKNATQYRFCVAISHFCVAFFV